MGELVGQEVSIELIEPEEESAIPTTSVATAVSLSSAHNYVRR